MSDLSAIFIKITKNMHITSMTDSFNSLKSSGIIELVCLAGVAILSITLLIRIVLFFAGGAALSDRNSKFILIKTITAFAIITFLFGSPVIYKLWIDAVIHLGQGITDVLFCASNRKAMIAFRLLSATANEAAEEGIIDIDPVMMDVTIEEFMSTASYVVFTIFYLIINSLPGFLISIVVIMGPIAAGFSFLKKDVVLSWVWLLIGTVMYSVVASAVLFVTQLYDIISITSDFGITGQTAGMLLTAAMGLAMLCCVGTIVSFIFGINRFDFGTMAISAIVLLVSAASGATAITIAASKKLISEIGSQG
jgi:hypothetical protein